MVSITIIIDTETVVSLSSSNVSSTYRIAQNFGGRKHWRIWRLGANSLKFYWPKFSIILVFYHCSTQSADVFSAKYILGANPPKFSTAKVLCYTVPYSGKRWQEKTLANSAI